MNDNEIIKELQEEIHLVEYVDGGYSEHASLKMLKGCLDLINRQKTEIRIIRIEAIKEFAEKLKSYMSNLEANYSPNKAYKTAMEDMLSYYVPKIIDDVVKEMTEGENGKL